MTKRRGINLLLAMVFCGGQLFCGTAANSAPEQQNQSAKTVKILGKLLTLKDSQGGGPGQPFIAEFIPAGETWDNWTMMYAVRFVPGDKPDPKRSAFATAQNVLQKKKEGDPVANAAIFEQSDGKSVAVDFLLSAPKPEMFEHNVFRYFAAPNGLVSLQIARRIYAGNSTEAQMQDFIKDIPKVRTQIFKELARPDLPTFGKS